MSRYNDLIVGDMHTQLSNLDDTERLLEFIHAQARDRKVQRIIFLGDLFHTHAIIRQEVAHLYKKWMKVFCNVASVRVLVGNHDGISPSDVYWNACDAVLSGCDYDYANKILVGAWSDDEYEYVDFMHKNDEFVNLVNMTTSHGGPNRILLCHQTFNGAAYENGSPVPGGVDANQILYPLIISGHIHTAQQVGKVLYVGTPRMVTRAEANTSKYIYHITGESAVAVNLEKICTDHLVKRYFSLTYKEADGIKLIVLAPDVKTGDEVNAQVEGSEEFYNEFVKMNESMVGRVRFIPKITQKLEGRVSIEETGDINQAMKKYVLEVADIPEDIKGKVWEKIRSLI